MGLLDPVAPPYDALEWEKQPFGAKCRQVCQAWALQGYGTPLGVYAVYALKALVYVGGWWFFCRFTPGLGSLRSIASWWMAPVAFQKAILWSMLFEILGLGCGSGPLTGRYVPPIGGFLYFLRPGTTKLPLVPGLPIAGGTRRTWLDVVLYAAALAALGRALVAPAIGLQHAIPIAALAALLAVTDKTVFLCARGEHYWTTVMVFVLAFDWIPGTKAVWAALWLWAGVSKLNHHFPAVVCVMTSNSPFTRFEWLRRRMYRGYPDDLSPSRLAVIAHGGTLLEFAVPVLLLAGHGGTVTWVGLVLMLVLHGFITSNVPMGVPIEWNVMMVYGGFFLFWKHADASLLGLNVPAATFLAVMLVAVPLLGNVMPSWISFLLAMRYYAGNWACSVWLFKGDSYRKLDRLKKSSAWVYDQLARLYDRRTSVGIVGKVMGFRLMHLHGRALPLLVPKAVDRVEDYEWVDGELVAGLALGWNFGDGHLHDEQLLRAVQEQCAFEAGELRCVFVESQPLGRATLHWRIADAKSGPLEQGDLQVRDLLARPPWPDGASTSGAG
jgi:hypothetical protein